MLQPHLTLPGAGQGSESKLSWNGSHPRVPARPPRSPARSQPYRVPPPSLGPAPAVADGAGHGDGEPQPPAELGASKAPRAGLAARAPAVLRRAADRAGNRPHGRCGQ